MRKLIRAAGVIVCLVLVILYFTDGMAVVRSTPGSLLSGDKKISELKSINGILYCVEEDNKTSAVTNNFSETLGNSVDTPAGTYTVKLLGIIPIKQVSVYARDRSLVIPGGTCVGVSMHTMGALVVGLGNVTTKSGESICPAQIAGIKPGDIIISVNGASVDDASSLVKSCSESIGSVSLSYRRNGEQYSCSVTPAEDAIDGISKMGLWVRDSTAGIGTLSFVDPDTLEFAALGHAITDIDTGTVLEVKDGEIIQSSVLGVVHGVNGTPGELKGTFSTISKRLGDVKINSEFGLYGHLYESYENPLFPHGVSIAFPEEAELGKAHLISTVDDDGMKAFECEVIRLYEQNSANSKGIVIEITDAELLERTGGIVQGMSGSPVIQNGKLIAVITHVFVSNPKRGYCIYAMWMQGE